MHTDMEARACDLAEYLLANNTTVRAAALDARSRARIRHAPHSKILTGSPIQGPADQDFLICFVP